MHLKVAYHNNSGEPVVIQANLKVARRIRQVILKNILALVVAKEGQGKVNIFNYEAHEDEVKPIPDDDFKVVQLYHNPTRFVKIGYGLSSKVKNMLINCLWSNADFSNISPHEMSDIQSYCSMTSVEHRSLGT